MRFNVKLGDIAKSVFNRPQRLGKWTRIGAQTTFGDDALVGDWTEIGENCRIGDRTNLGPHVRIGSNVEIGADCILPDHVHVQDGVCIPEGSVFEGHELVTPDGIIPYRCSGYTLCGDENGNDPLVLAGIFGEFEIPPAVFNENTVRDFLMGTSDALEPYRTRDPVRPVEDAESVPEF